MSIGLFSWNFSKELSSLLSEGYNTPSCQHSGGWGWERPGLPLVQSHLQLCLSWSLGPESPGPHFPMDQTSHLLWVWRHVIPGLQEVRPKFKGSNCFLYKLSTNFPASISHLIPPWKVHVKGVIWMSKGKLGAKKNQNSKWGNKGEMKN